MIAAILMNPPITGGTQTMRSLRALEEVRGRPVQHVNLFALPTKSFDQLSGVAHVERHWWAARAQLFEAVNAADELIAAWGVGGLTGMARHRFAEQVRYVLAEAEAAGHTEIWTLLGEARHPSRWHQFLSDRHGRVTPGTPTERLRQALVAVPLAFLAPVTHDGRTTGSQTAAHGLRNAQ